MRQYPQQAQDGDWSPVFNKWQLVVRVALHRSEHHGSCSRNIFSLRPGDQEMPFYQLCVRTVSSEEVHQRNCYLELLCRILLQKEREESESFLEIARDEIKIIQSPGQTQDLKWETKSQVKNQAEVEWKRGKYENYGITFTIT